MAAGSLGGGSDDGLGKALVLAHALGQTHAAQLAAAFLVGTPGTAGENAAYDHLNGEAFALETHGDHGVGGGQFPVGHDVGRGVEKLSSDLVEHLALAGNALGQDDVECRDAVGSHHHQDVVVDVVHVAHFAMINTLLTFKMKIGVN